MESMHGYVGNVAITESGESVRYVARANREIERPLVSKEC